MERKRVARMNGDLDSDEEEGAMRTRTKKSKKYSRMTDDDLEDGWTLDERSGILMPPQDPDRDPAKVQSCNTHATRLLADVDIECTWSTCRLTASYCPRNVMEGKK